MPYIKSENRQKYDEAIDLIASIETKGDLEYCLSRLMNIFMLTRRFSYSDLHECAYAAQHACDEFRRRFLDKREDNAIAANGDCFDFFGPAGTGRT